MSTKIAAALLALTFATGISFPAAADDASAVRTQSAATVTPVQPRPETSGQFAILSDVRADALSSRAMDLTRGAGGVWITTTPSSGLLHASNNPDGRNLLRFDGSVDFNP